MVALWLCGLLSLGDGSRSLAWRPKVGETAEYVVSLEVGETSMWGTVRRTVVAVAPGGGYTLELRSEGMTMGSKGESSIDERVVTKRVVYGPRGEVLSAKGGDGRQAAIVALVVPIGEVMRGQRWTYSGAAGPGWPASESKFELLILDEGRAVVAGSARETGTSPMSMEGTWTLDRSGALVGFSGRFLNFAGQAGVEAKLTLTRV